MTVPYATASSDMRAREEVKKILTRFGSKLDQCARCKRTRPHGPSGTPHTDEIIE
jgi:hypothetical protein